MINREQLKFDAKDALRGKWGTGVIITLIYCALTALFSYIPVISIFLISVLQFGMTISFLRLVRTGTYDIADLFDGFKDFAKSAFLGFVITLFTILWSLLLIIPGIVAALSYSMAYFILADNPDINFMDAIKQSKEITNGYKMDIFILFLSFIGWDILCIFTLGIGELWLVPYKQTTFTNLYEQLKNKVMNVEYAVE